jgi:hypothetical protein
VWSFSCWKYRCSPCLKNSPRTLTFPIRHPPRASPHSSWPSCKGKQWLLAQCVVSTQFVANILFNNEALFTMGGIVNSIIPLSGWMTPPCIKTSTSTFHQRQGGLLWWSTLRTSCLR